MNEMNNGENGINQNQENSNIQEQQVQQVEPVQEPIVENEEPPKKGNTLLIIILLVLVIGLAGYIVYDKAFKKEEIPKQEEKGTEEKEESSKYAIIFGRGYNEKLKKNNDFFYFAQESKDAYKVIYDFGTTDNKSYIGFYDNKLYFTDEYSIKYIDLSNNFEEKTWIELPKPDEEHKYSSFAISKTVIVGDRLYFNFGDYNQGLDKIDGLLYLDFTAKSFDEYKQLINEVDSEKWYFSDAKDKIYYQTNDGAYELVIATNKKTKLIDFDSMQYHLLTKDIFYFKNKIFYLYDSTLYMYDINNKNTDVVTKNFDTAKNGMLYNVIQSVNDKVYYSTTEGKLYLLDVDTNKSTLYYEISNNDTYRGFHILDDKTIVIFHENHVPDQYLVNGKEVETIYKKVLLKDNSYEEIELNMFSKYIDISK